ncbi:hypothetical protein BT69DRAFT_1243626 [Atractiella rhizophila]|nr:hypothetical protein BT69DRAFT_1251160 [Atractiella rhizophila]KAH8921970.1 hypothetical protein BT69DRAFT_1243626 [Atractiella rhizophila]
MVRFKNRYLLTQFHFSPDSSPPQLLEKEIASILRDSLVTNFGDITGGGLSGGIVVKYYSPVTNLSIIRCSREGHKHIWAALTLLRSIKGQPVIAQVLHVGGTIRKTQQAAIVHNRTLILGFKDGEKILQDEETKIQGLEA